MKSGAFAILIASMAALSGGLAMSSLSDDVADDFECEDLVEGDRIEMEMKDQGADSRQEFRVRVEADTRFQVEVEFRQEGTVSADPIVEPLHGGGDEDDEEDPPAAVDRRARLRICGFVQFADDGDGMLGSNDTIVRSDLVRFGLIERTETADAWVFTSVAEDGSLSVTARVPRAPDDSGALIAWTVEARHACGPDASHYAILIDQSDPTDEERFVAAECGADLMATGEA